MKTSPITHRLYYLLAPQSAVITTRAHGIDISKYDLEFVPENATGQLDFVWQRISYRLTRDEAFEKLLPGVMRVPIRMGYHYLNSGTDWKAQADAYLSYISGLEYHAHAVDFEGTANTLSQSFAYDAWKWRDYVEQKTGKITHLYTGRYLYQDWLIPSQKTYGINWDTVPLWHAQYFYVPNPDGTPNLPTGRNTGWTFWQYTSSGNGNTYGAGRSYACDLDVFNGTPDELKEYLNIGGTVPPVGGTMKYELRPAGSYNVSIRAENPDAHILGSAVGSILNGTTAQADAKYVYTADKYVSGVLRAKAGDVWYHVTSPAVGWSAELHLGVRYCTVTEIPVITEDVTVIIQRDGWKDLTLTGKQEKA